MFDRVYFYAFYIIIIIIIEGLSLLQSIPPTTADKQMHFIYGTVIASQHFFWSAEGIHNCILYIHQGSLDWEQKQFFSRFGELLIFVLPGNEKRAASNILIPFSPLASNFPW